MRAAAAAAAAARPPLRRHLAATRPLSVMAAPAAASTTAAPPAAAGAGAGAPAPPPLVPAPDGGPPAYRCGPALATRVVATCGRARALDLFLPHGPVRTPVFMPVGTQGTVKGLTTVELQSPPLDCDIILGNTYHLGNRPGGDALEARGGLHRFMAWPRPLLTDSGGFQMVSLLHLADITEAGVTFQSPADGSEMLLALDDVVDSKTVDAARFAEATARTLRWIDRCIAAHARPGDQNLFGILQGGLDVSPAGLREACLTGMLARDAHLPGYAIGGLAGGEAKSAFWRVVAHATARLPPSKPRYLMGVGYPLDLVVCTALGVDMYDCVYPTRTARFGTALAGVPGGVVKLKSAAMAGDGRPIDPACPCYVCARYTRAALHIALKTEALGPQLVTYHNIAYMMTLTRAMRAAVVAGEYPAFVRAFLSRMFPAHRSVPGWAVDALAAAGIDVEDMRAPGGDGDGGGGGGGGVGGDNGGADA
jgi:queuine tRNA-ribosyltransferase catalytic subunit